MTIDWNYVGTGYIRWDEAMGINVGRLEWLLQAGMHYDEVIQLRHLSTKARLVSDYLDEVEKRTNGVVSPRNEATNQTGT